MKLKVLQAKRILIISPEPWNHIPVSKHHYSLELASLGNLIFFLNPPSNENSISSPSDHENLRIINYRGFPGLNRLPTSLSSPLNQVLIRKILKMCGGGFDIVWTFDPFRFQNLNLFGPAIKIYHAVDIHKSPLERMTAISCHVILSVSDLILERFEFAGKPKFKVNHGLASHFLSGIKPNIRGRLPLRLTAGYIGNLDNWCVDKSTLLDIVESHPGVDFYFIGPYKPDSPIVSSLKKFNNCQLIGKVPSSALPDHLNRCDFFLMCYDGSNRAVNSNHHKIIEFLATGKPVVMNYTNEYSDKQDLVVMSNSNSELPVLFAQVVERIQDFNTDELIQKRMTFARSNSYRNHVIYIDNILDKIVNVPNII
ncbi:MAG: hypothetical protein R2820_08850 [Cyclobacteriaceae bacterium]|nr:hypothetical protein [Cyclobacteriaceae bacterium]